MLYLVEVSDSIRYLESRLKEIFKKLVKCVKGLLIQELLARVDTLEANVRRTVNYERGDSSSGFVAHMEKRVNELDSFQKTLLDMRNGMSEDFRATLDVVRNGITDVNARLNLTVRAMANQAPVEGAILYFRATNTVTEEAKVTLAMMHLSEDAKLWWRSWYVDMQEGRCTIDTWDALKKELRSQFFPENVEILARRKLRELKHTGSIREYVKQFVVLMLDIHDMSEKDKVFCFVEGLKPWAKTKLYEQRAQDLTSVYAAAQQLFDLTSDSQDVRRHQSSSPRRNRNSRPSSPKAVGGDKRFGKDRRPYQSNTENTWRRSNNRSPPKCPLSCFICEGPHLARDYPNKADFHAFHALLTLDINDRSNQAEGEVDEIEGGEKPRIGALKYLSSLQKKAWERSVQVERGLLYVNTWINQKQTKSTMIDSEVTHNFITEAEARRLRQCWEKDSERMKVVNSVALPIDFSPPEFYQIEVRKRNIVVTCDRRIPKSVAELCSYPELANRNGQFIEGFLKSASSLTELLKEEDIHWGGNLECQAVFDGLKQATIEGPSLRVADATKPSKVEAEQFNYMLREYLHHFVDGRQRNWVHMLNVFQFGHDAQTDSLIRRSQFEIDGSTHSVLPSITDGPYVGNSPQFHKVEKEWEQMADIT
ncbi:uncharacterized protein E5676_scaffold298G00720 [Cucumis melo var. makuwa]|uniref:Retrotransposon gag domain-containing protein n=1 Tax=Cucumis melo var. makuwa TaxID=1194695 RepID=A0A5D3BVR8_CUCMM|nr:uncharacterized protein E6C27_scaffold230G00560 [Cucumis melo var. makuwa]TYK03254.1 uncharacterized protein E5676_scaffold298G00720 [Cucumis melo var. makuwa]